MFPDRNAAAVLDALATGVLVLDAHDRVDHLNPAAESLLGVTRRQSVGRAFAECAGHARLIAIVGRARATGGSFGVRELALTASTVDCRVSPIEAGALLVELDDVRGRLQLRRENALLEQLAASRLMLRQLAHEIRNPLGGLRGAAQLLERELEHPELREYTGVILREADRLTALVDGMLGPRGAPHLKRTNIHRVLDHVERLVRAEAPPGIELLRDYDPSLPPMQLDGDEIVQAVLNLARNAVQALAGEGRISLRSRAATGATIGDRRHPLVARIEVEDDGPGIPEELRGRIFFPLVTGRRDGSGLGLALAQALVQRHDGLIECDSRPGHTVFRVLLPVRQEAA